MDGNSNTTLITVKRKRGVYLDGRRLRLLDLTKMKVSYAGMFNAKKALDIPDEYSITRFIHKDMIGKTEELIDFLNLPDKRISMKVRNFILIDKHEFYGLPHSTLIGFDYQIKDAYEGFTTFDEAAAVAKKLYRFHVQLQAPTKSYSGKTVRLELSDSKSTDKEIFQTDGKAATGSKRRNG